LERDLPGVWGFQLFVDQPEHSHGSVSSVAVRISAPTSDQDLPRWVSQFGTEFNVWFATVAQWLELWTRQIIAPDPNGDLGTRGRLADVDAPALASGWHRPSGPVFMQHPSVAIGRQQMEAACGHASNSLQPPDEWLLYLRARRGSDERIALIEAATAAEVALSRAIAHRLTGTPADAVQRIIEGANGLVGLLRLLESMDESTESRWKRAAHRLAHPRNRAVHGGVQSTAEERLAALQEAFELLQCYSPLPGPPTG
jgi:hypothetical protein